MYGEKKGGNKTEKVWRFSRLEETVNGQKGNKKGLNVSGVKVRRFPSSSWESRSRQFETRLSDYKVFNILRVKENCKLLKTLVLRK